MLRGAVRPGVLGCTVCACMLVIFCPFHRSVISPLSAAQRNLCISATAHGASVVLSL